MSVIVKTLNMTRSTVSDTIKRMLDRNLGCWTTASGEDAVRFYVPFGLHKCTRQSDDESIRNYTFSFQRLAKSLKISKTSATTIVYDKLYKNNFQNEV